MKNNPFDRTKHVYQNDAFSELVKDAVRFFNGTPVHTLPPPEKFFGTGVYALYYIGDNFIYQKCAELNRLSYDYPIYVGKAVPKGWRRSRISDSEDRQSTELYSRLNEHKRSISVAGGLNINHFMCRFVIFENEGSDMISTIEAALIKLNMPVWNTVLDGFGNHDPGSGRYEQAKSDWDVVHPGRPWADRLKGTPRQLHSIVANLDLHMGTVGKK